MQQDTDYRPQETGSEDGAPGIAQTDPGQLPDSFYATVATNY